MGENTLVPPLIYESCDMKQDSIPLEEIKYIGISVTPLKNVSIIETMKKLEIVVFRLCNLTTFPEELLTLPNIRSIDLSGNSIEHLPNSGLFGEIPTLISLNMSENNIVDLSEFTNLMSLPNLKLLNFMGNICQTSHNPINRLLELMPNLEVINDNIILSQHKAWIEKLAIQDKYSMIPLSKTDDFFFRYVKYIRATGMERYIRKFNTELFCLNKVMRKYDSVIKIQSVFRGYLQRTYYKKMKNAALMIQLRIKMWYRKRMKAATVIQRNFLRFLLRRQIKFNKAVKKIQSMWRKKLGCDKALQVLFTSMDSNEIQFYITKDKLEFFLNFCKENNFVSPEIEEDNKFKVLKKQKPTKLRLPGSPLVYYSIDDSLVIRKINKPKEIPKNFSLWCKHDHEKLKKTIVVNKDGVNYGDVCILSSIRPLINNKPIKKIESKGRNENTLILCKYKAYSDVLPIINSLRVTHPDDFQLIPTRNITNITSIVTIQNAMRAFIIRKKEFKNIREMVIENRSKNIIRRFFRFLKITRVMKRIVDTKTFSDTLYNTSFIYVTQETLQSLLKIKPKFDLHFGYNMDREIVLVPGQERNVVTMSIPEQQPIFKDNDLPSILHVGATIVAARKTMFDDERISQKFLNKFKIKRITFSSIQETKNRATLLTWLTDLHNWCMNEQDVLELWAATTIKNCWIGHTTRKSLYYISSQLGRPLKTQLLIVRTTVEKEKAFGIINVNYDRAKALRERLSIKEQISQLRGEYTPWKQDIELYRQQRERELKEYSKQAAQEKYLQKRQQQQQNERENLSSSKMMIGLIDSFEPPEQDKRNKSQDETPIQTTHNTPRDIFEVTTTTSTILDTQNTEINLSRAGTSTIKSRALPSSAKGAREKPTLTSKKVKKLIDFQSETDHTFAPPISDFDIGTTNAQKRRPQTVMERNVQIRPNAKAQIIAKPVLPVSTGLGTIQPQMQAIKTDRTPRRRQGATSAVSALPLGTVRTRTLEPVDFDDEMSSQVSGNSTARSASVLENSVISANSSIANTQDNKSLYSNPSNQSKTITINSQITDRSMEERAKANFTRLTRLFQITDAVFHEQIVDNTLEEKRQATVRARTAIQQKREETYQKLYEDNQAIRAVSQIEREERLHNAEKVKNRALEQKTVAAKNIRKEHKKKEEKYKQNTLFAQKFVSATRKLAQQCEARHMKVAARKEFEAMQEKTEKFRQENIQVKERARTAISENKQRKLEVARIDKNLFEEKKEVVSRQQEERRQRLYELKQQLKDTMSQVYEMRERGVQYVFPNMQETVLMDDIEGTAATLSTVLDVNFGFEEAHILASLLHDYINE